MRENCFGKLAWQIALYYDLTPDPMIKLASINHPQQISAFRFYKRNGIIVRSNLSYRASVFHRTFHSMDELLIG